MTADGAGDGSEVRGAGDKADSEMGEAWSRDPRPDGTAEGVGLMMRGYFNQPFWVSKSGELGGSDGRHQRYHRTLYNSDYSG